MVLGICNFGHMTQNKIFILFLNLSFKRRYSKITQSKKTMMISASVLVRTVDRGHS
jgi:hypothetical protein